jgi:hypothetical protein
MKRKKIILISIIMLGIFAACGETKKTAHTKVVTYEDYNNFSGESELNIEQLTDLFELMDWNKDAFLYFPVTDINLFQIISHKDNRFLVEITNDSNDMIFHQKYASRHECKELIRKLFEKDSLDSEILCGFYKVPITSKTLDDVISGK